MKKYGIFTLVLVFALCLTACGRRNTQETTNNTMAPTIITPTTILDPTIMNPTIDTNIPDPNVDTSMPSTDDTSNGTTDSTIARNRTGMNIR